MAGKVRIVTDSSASFEDPNFVDDYEITVVPLNVHFGNQAYQEGIDIGAEEVFTRVNHTNEIPRISAPPADVFESVYQSLGKTTDQICVLVSSAQFTKAHEHAQMARSSLLGRCDIAVIDSMTTSLGLGYLVQTIAEAAHRGSNLDEVVRIARSIVPRLYSIYYVDTLEYIRQAGLIGATQATLGTMLEIKPLLTIENGKLIAMEKARTHSQAIDKMVEFVTEFTYISKLGILQNTLQITDQTRMLQDRLALEFARLQYPLMLYEPLLLSVIGPNAMGMAIMEGIDDL